MLEKFLEYLAVEKNYSPHTLTAYQRDVEVFLRLAAAADLCVTQQDDAESAAHMYVQELSMQGLSASSINRKVSSLKGFYKFLLQIREVDFQPFEQVKSLKNNRVPKVPLSISEMKAFQNIETETDSIGYILVEFLYQTGVRRAELCNLLKKDVSFREGWVKVMGKGRKERFIPLSEELSAKLQEWDEALPEDRTYFFVTPKGTKMGEKFVYLEVKKYLSLVSQGKQLSPHMLRHSFATHLLQNDADISSVKELMGHSTLAATQIYTHADIETLKNAVRRSHPRNREE